MLSYSQPVPHILSHSGSQLLARPIAIAGVYRPPRGDIQEFCHSLDTSIPHAKQKSGHILLLGDFNSKHPDWLHSDSTDRYGEGMQYLIEMNNLHQLVEFPTHIVGNRLSSCLDLVITSLERSQVTLTSLPPLGQADHLILHGQLLSLSLFTGARSTLSTTSTSSPRWCWKEDRLTRLRSSLSAKLQLYTDEYARSKCMEDLWQEWRSTVLDEATLSCSKQQCRPSKRPMWQARPWITPELIDEINEKHKLYRVYLRTRTPDNWCNFTAQRNRVTFLLREAKSAFAVSKT